MRLIKNDKNKVLQQVRSQVLDGIVASNSNLVDDIILSMMRDGVLDCLNNSFPDKRKKNSTIPLSFIMALAIAAKMKVKTSLTDIPYAIQDHRTLAELGYNILNDDADDGWLTEGTIRHLIGKYESKDLIDYYNDVVQNQVYTRFDISPDIHILDCTKIAVNFDNYNYENASLAYDRKGNKMRGYKLASLRGLYADSGIIEEIRFNTASTHDFAICEDILKKSKCLKENDILLMDRGFISRKMLKHLKEERKIDVYIPLRRDMAEFDMAVTLAEELDDWKPHPSRDSQMICHIPKVDGSWAGNIIDDSISLNACVIWFEDTQTYAVITTTDMTKSAKQILETYDLRTEIEEDFRQLKEFWKLEDFKSTKYNVITFHIVCVLFGYLFYQLYLSTEDGAKYIGKCLPVILKNYKMQFLNYLVLYSGEYFCSMSMKEFMMYFDGCEEDVKNLILSYMG